MIVIDRNARVPYSVAQMYALVKDVPAYPSFLPWCSGAEILEQLPDGARGRVDIRKGPLRHSFATRNTFRHNRCISMRLEEGPFSHLHGVWRFQPLGAAADSEHSEHNEGGEERNGSEVTLHLEFDFSNKLARMTIGPVFSHIADRMVDAFVQRAERVYGR